MSGVNIDNCEHPCKGQPCLNGGKCIPVKDYYQCSCPVGFENSNCEDSELLFYDDNKWLLLVDDICLL